MTSRILLPLLLALNSTAFAETVKDRDGAVRGDREALKQRADWIYNDLAAGLAEGKRTGKPLFVTLRCLP